MSSKTSSILISVPATFTVSLGVPNDIAISSNWVRPAERGPHYPAGLVPTFAPLADFILKPTSQRQRTPLGRNIVYFWLSDSTTPWNVKLPQVNVTTGGRPSASTMVTI